jgi:signal transduction histidine kinase
VEKSKEQLKSELKDALQQISKLKMLQNQCREMEAQIIQQNEFFNHVLESLTHPFYVLDANDYTIKIANSAARLGDLSAKPTCYGLTHRRTVPCNGLEHTCPLQQVKKTKQPGCVEHIHYDIKGNIRNVEVHAYPIFDAQGNVVQMIEYLLDITDRKNLEKEIKAYSEKLKLFAYSVTHDIKNPLIGINGLTKILCKNYSGTFDDKGKVICDQIIKSSKQVLALVEEINVYVKSQEAPLHFEPFNPNEIIEQIRLEFGSSIVNRHIDWSASADIPVITADRISFLRVLRNLVDNALKYGGPGLSDIKIGYKESADFHIFFVSDDGAGIKEENLEKVFIAFQRGQTSQGPEGTGLGLAIVKEISAKHGGKAWVAREGEKGVTFYISISKTL